jgi:hypothetical protein
MKPTRGSRNPYVDRNPYDPSNFLQSPSTHYSEPHRSAKIEVRLLEDWVHRLVDFAHEAGDERLRVLESDLLDLRDEIRDYIK